MKKIIVLMCALLAVFMETKAQKGFNPGQLQVKWEVLQNNYQGKQQFRDELILSNPGVGELPSSGWKIYFNFPRMILPATVEGPVKMAHANGDLFYFEPAADFKGLKPGDSVRIEFTADAWAVNITDGPDGLYFVENDKENVQVALKKVIAVPSEKAEQLMRIPADKIAPVTPKEVYTQNKVITDLPESSLPIIFPTPSSLSRQPGYFTISGTTAVSSDPAFKKESDYLKSELQQIFKRKPSAAFKGSIVIKKDPSLKAEAYDLTVAPSRITISAGDSAGAFYGIQSIKSMLPADAWAGKVATVNLPCVTVKDKPRFGYRGMLLDVARNFQSKQQLLKVIDLLGFYKLNTLHLHLSDDEGWRLEIPSLPELTSVGGHRGHTLTNTDHLQPAYGSGPHTDNPAGNGFYTRQDYIEILRYANARHITVIPEIESPGHARAAIKSMDVRYNRLMKAGDKTEAHRYLLHDLKDKSVYSSVQNWNDNVMDVSMPSTYNFIGTVVDEVVKMYREAGAPLKTIHMGGDEVPAGVWQKSPSVEKLRSELPEIEGTEQLWLYYYTRVDEILKKHNLYTSAWEEAGLKKELVNNISKNVPNTDFAQRRMHLYVWNNVLGGGAEDLAYRLANGGFPVILSCVTNLYFDMAYHKEFAEPGYYWGGYLDVDKPFKFIPLNYLKNSHEDNLGNMIPAEVLSHKEALTATGKANIVGIQGQLWSETVRSKERMEYMLLPKLLGLAERAWAPDPDWATDPDPIASEGKYQKSWVAFCNQLGKKELPKLDYINKGYQYRIPTAGVEIDGGMVKANSQFPGFIIRYTTDGSIPTVKSSEYKQPLTIRGKINFRVFNKAGRGGRTVSVTN
ncbi:carbohydate-binding domain-containing protein [Mucilaginibacter sp. RS28]|uniref:beta-N-acetylhexosaminidase n=1 Tax=Mucilaginibacter straminoryzae TaxID=2932774 RepID=A0A9X2B8W2_9SPHI|nr:family 20 glycosylhydrolase [Mucilaginibacter straminoryzae]MCJ8209821.1 carbohydate-binding domain-containing protein [Mucilaginibacter straminoryzae]